MMMARMLLRVFECAIRGPLGDNLELIQASHCVCDTGRCLDVISSLWLLAAK